MSVTAAQPHPVVQLLRAGGSQGAFLVLSETAGHDQNLRDPNFKAMEAFPAASHSWSAGVMI